MVFEVNKRNSINLLLFFSNKQTLKRVNIVQHNKYLNYEYLQKKFLSKVFKFEKQIGTNLN